MPGDDLNARAVVRTGAAIALAVAAVVAAVLLLLRHWQLPAGGAPLAPGPAMAADAPVLQSAPQFDLARYRDEKRRLLESSAWVDPAAGIVRIPVSEAMEILVRRSSVPPEPPGPRKEGR